MRWQPVLTLAHCNNDQHIRTLRAPKFPLKCLGPLQGSASRSVASGDPCRTQSLDSRIPDFVTNMHSHIPHVPYLSSRGNAWPIWRGGSVLLPFDSHVAGMSSPLPGMSSPLPTQETDVNGTTVGECNAISNAGDSRVVRHGESKKTL